MKPEVTFASSDFDWIVFVQDKSFFLEKKCVSLRAPVQYQYSTVQVRFTRIFLFRSVTEKMHLSFIDQT